MYRFSSGDITDIWERRSGQVDIVAEYPLMASFPLANNTPRLYLAESVALVIEVKSNLKSQWPKVLETARKVKALERWYRRDEETQSAQW